VRLSGTADFLVLGGGIVGVTIGAELKRRHPDSRVVLLEKEGKCGLHASGRNSGVLHAGFYYTADSLKARFSRDGNRELTEFCLQKGLKINRCGKLVVTRSEEEVSALTELFARARRNGVQVEEVPAEDVPRVDPQARSVGPALFSPTTSTVDPPEVVAALTADARASGVDIRTGTAYRGCRRGRILTSDGELPAGYVVNTAGLHADRIARDFGFSEDYRVLPFRGLYSRYMGPGPVPRLHIYPVPRLDYPFLGVHWTATLNGGTKIGPTAIPALWREHYRGLGNMRPKEMLEIGVREADLWFRDSFGFRRLAWLEIQKLSQRRLVRLARELVGDSAAPGRWRWGSPGVRAQLLDLRTRRLDMDFRCEGDDRSYHVLNAVSPAFTCALPFARHAVDEIEKHLRGGISSERTRSETSAQPTSDSLEHIEGEQPCTT
jgi:L-2-hydroxyglutarate oxidase LhgO